MKKPSVAVLILTAALAASIAAKADYYTFTSGSVITLNDTSVSDYVTNVSDANASHSYAVDSTKKGGTFTLNLNNATAGDYVFTMLGTGDGYSVNCKLEVNGVTDTSYSKTLTFLQADTKAGTTLEHSNLGDSNSTSCNAQKTFMALPSLPQGNFTVKFTIVSRPDGATQWCGNYGYFTLTSGTAVDLEGYNSIVTDANAFPSSGYVTINNSSSTLSTLTLKDGVTTTANLQKFNVQGNTLLVFDGYTSDFKFPGSDVAGYANLYNTHTGGTTFTNSSKKVNIYNFRDNLGTGTVTFGGGTYIQIPSNNRRNTNGTYDYNKINNALVINGDGNKLDLQSSNWNDTTKYEFLSTISGSGNLLVLDGYKPRISFEDKTGNKYNDFTGEISFAYAIDSSYVKSVSDIMSNNNNLYGFWINERTPGFTNAKVKLTTKSGSETQQNRIWIKTGYNISDIYFGSLYTDGNGSVVHADTAVIANGGNNFTYNLHVGSVDTASDARVFEGAFLESTSQNQANPSKFKFYKEGLGSLELKGTTASSFTEGVVVSAGTLTVNTTISAGAVSVASGATLAGSGTIPSVSFASGAILSTTNMTVTGASNFNTAPYVYLDPNTLEAGQTYTILTSNSMPGNALLHEDMTNQIAGVKLTQESNTLTLKVPVNVVAPGGTAKNVSATSEEDALAAVAIKLSDSDIAAGRKTSYYKKVATVKGSGVWSVAVKLADEVEVEIGTETTPSVTASKVTFSPPTNLKPGLYYGVASGNSVGSLACTQNEPYDGTTPPTLSANMPDSGVMYYSIEVSDTDKSSN